MGVDFAQESVIYFFKLFFSFLKVIHVESALPCLFTFRSLKETTFFQLKSAANNVRIRWIEIIVMYFRFECKHVVLGFTFGVINSKIDRCNGPIRFANKMKFESVRFYVVSIILKCVDVYAFNTFSLYGSS